MTNEMQGRVHYNIKHTAAIFSTPILHEEIDLDWKLMEDEESIFGSGLPLIYNLFSKWPDVKQVRPKRELLAVSASGVDKGYGENMNRSLFSLR